MDCATMRSDVIGDFQEPYGAVLVEEDDMAALRFTGELRKRLTDTGARGRRWRQFARGAADGATLPAVDGARPPNATREAALRIRPVMASSVSIISCHSACGRGKIASRSPVSSTSSA